MKATIREDNRKSYELKRLVSFILSNYTNGRTYRQNDYALKRV